MDNPEGKTLAIAIDTQSGSTVVRMRHFPEGKIPWVVQRAWGVTAQQLTEILYQRYCLSDASVAQSAEHRPRKTDVGGSIPPGGSK